MTCRLIVTEEQGVHPPAFDIGDTVSYSINGHDGLSALQIGHVTGCRCGQKMMSDMSTRHRRKGVTGVGSTVQRYKEKMIT
jgi:hypothetical protein